MKFRKDFVTNSSSSSFICCFARIADPEKAQAVLDKHGDRIEVYTAEEVLANIKNRRWGAWLEADWAGVDVTPTENYIRDHAESKFVVAEDCQDVEEDEDGYPDYDVDYSYFNTDAIDDITEKTGSLKLTASGEPAETANRRQYESKRRFCDKQLIQ